jgi:hypothetical protein
MELQINKLNYGISIKIIIKEQMTQILNNNGYIVKEITGFNQSPFYNEAIFRKIPLTENIIHPKIRNPNGREQHYIIYI